jgi:hypothetical protein
MWIDFVAGILKGGDLRNGNWCMAITEKGLGNDLWEDVQTLFQIIKDTLHTRDNNL